MTARFSAPEGSPLQTLCAVYVLYHDQLDFEVVMLATARAHCPMLTMGELLHTMTAIEATYAVSCEQAHTFYTDTQDFESTLSVYSNGLFR